MLNYIKVANINFVYEYKSKCKSNFVDQILKEHELIRILKLLKIDYKCNVEETKLERVGANSYLHVINIEVFIHKAFGLKYDVESVLGILVETVRNGTNNYDETLEECYYKSLDYAEGVFGLDKVQAHEMERIYGRKEKMKRGLIVAYSQREANVKIKIYNSIGFKFNKAFKAFFSSSKDKLRVNYTVQEDNNINKLKIKIFITILVLLASAIGAIVYFLK